MLYYARSVPLVWSFFGFLAGEEVCSGTWTSGGTHYNPPLYCKEFCCASLAGVKFCCDDIEKRYIGADVTAAKTAATTVVVISLGAVVLVVSLALVYFCCYYCKRERQNEDSMPSPSVDSQGLHRMPSTMSNSSTTTTTTTTDLNLGAPPQQLTPTYSMVEFMRAVLGAQVPPYGSCPPPPSYNYAVSSNQNANDQGTPVTGTNNTASTVPHVYVTTTNLAARDVSADGDRLRPLDAATVTIDCAMTGNGSVRRRSSGHSIPIFRMGNSSSHQLPKEDPQRDVPQCSEADAPMSPAVSTLTFDPDAAPSPRRRSVETPMTQIDS